MVRCIQCGTDNQQGSRFCASCGANLTAQAQMPPPLPAAQSGYAPPMQAGSPGPAAPQQGAQYGYVPPPNYQAPPPPAAQLGYAPPMQAGSPGAAAPQQGAQYDYAPPPSNYQVPPPPGQVNYGPPPPPDVQPAGYPQPYPQQPYAQQPYPQQSPGYAFEKTEKLGWKRNKAGIVCYVFGWLSGIVMYILEKDAFVRFHAAQSVLLFGGLTVVSMLLPMFLPRGMYRSIASVTSMLSAVSMVLWIVMMYKAGKGEYFKLPIVGALAEKFSKER